MIRQVAIQAWCSSAQHALRPGATGIRALTRALWDQNAGLEVADIAGDFLAQKGQQGPIFFAVRILRVPANGVSGDNDGIAFFHGNKDDTICCNPGMVKLGTVRFKARCDRHPGFDPLDGPGAIRGGCRRCELLLEIYQAHGRLVDLMRRAKNDSSPLSAKRAAASADERQATLF